MTYRSKSPDEIEQDIRATRAHIDRTLDVLTARLSPSGLVDQAVRVARETGGEFGLNLGRTVRDNPIPTALLGIGLGWLMMSGRRSDGGYDGGYRSEVVSDRAVGERHRYGGVSETGVAPTSSVEARNPDVPDDWSSAYEDQPDEWVDAEGRPRSGARAERAKAAAKGAYYDAKGRAEDTAAEVRGSAADASRKGADAARDAKERGKAAAREASERLRATGRDASGAVQDAAERARQYGSETAGRASAAYREGRYRASETLHSAGDAGRRASGALRESAQDAYRRGGRLARSAGGQARDLAGSAGTMAKDHPLAVGLALAAAGAVLASMAPRTRQEDEWLGEKSDRVKDAAREAALTQVDRARDAASAAVDAGVEEARRKGLTPEGAKETLDKTVADGVNVVRTAAQAGADKAKGEVDKASSDTSREENDRLDRSPERKPDAPSASTESDRSVASALSETGRVSGVSGISTEAESKPVTAGGSFGSTMDSHPVDPDKSGETSSAANRV